MSEEISPMVRFNALLIRLELLEAEFQRTNPGNAKRRYLIQIELADAYRQYNETLPQIQNTPSNDTKELHATQPAVY